MFPMDEFPFTYGTTTDPLTGRTDGLFRQCSTTKTCPKVIQVDADSESYQGHASLVVTDTRGRDITLPPEVRYYYVTTAHLQGDAGCRDAANPVSPWPYYRAAYDALVRWVRDGVSPPPTSVPSVAKGTFVTAAEQFKQYPSIPGKPYNTKISEVGIPEIAAPVATLSGKALRGKGFAEGELCSVNGSTLPFPKTKAERLASGDSRLSLEERYPGGQRERAERYTRAVNRLVADRYLLPEDGARMIDAVSATTTQ
jgi:hypothetical protein